MLWLQASAASPMRQPLKPAPSPHLATSLLPCACFPQPRQGVDPDTLHALMSSQSSSCVSLCLLLPCSRPETTGAVFITKHWQCVGRPTLSYLLVCQQCANNLCLLLTHIPQSFWQAFRQLVGIMDHAAALDLLSMLQATIDVNICSGYAAALVRCHDTDVLQLNGICVTSGIRQPSTSSQVMTITI